MHLNVAILAACALVYSLVAGRIGKLALSGPIVQVAFGLILGPVGLGVLDLDVDAEDLRILAELTLALVLFAGAANADLGVLEKTYWLPGRLVLIGLPLTILAGFGMGIALFEDLSLFEVAILAPTDAALGKAVVQDKAVPGQWTAAGSATAGVGFTW